MFELMDLHCAEILGISVEEYVDKIEKLITKYPYRSTVIIDGLLSDDKKQEERVKIIFHTLKI